MNELIFSALGLVCGFFLCYFLMRKSSPTSGGLPAAPRRTAENDLKLWNAFSDAMPIHVFIKRADGDFRYVYSNRARNDFFGLSHDAMLEKNDARLLPRQAAEQQMAADAEILNQAPGIYEQNLEIPDRQGKIHYFRMAQTQFTDSTGSRLLLGVAWDISSETESRLQLTATELKLAEQERWLSRLLGTIGDAVMVTDPSGNITILNPVAERMLGVTAQNAIGKPHETFFKTADAVDGKPYPSPVSQALESGAPAATAARVELIGQPRQHCYIESSALPVVDQQQRLQGAILVFRDVTEACRQKTALHDAVRDWEMASAVSRIASFRINYRTREISGSRLLPEYWPIVEGKAVPPEEWVLPEDVSVGVKMMNDIASGKARQTFYQYRAGKAGTIRHYSVYGVVDPERPDEIAGIIQDMTEAFEHEAVLRNTQVMWNSLIDALPLNFFAKNADDSFRYTHCNKRFAEFLGKKTEDIIGKTDAEIFPVSSDSTHFRSDDLAILQSGRASNFTEAAFGANHLRPTQFQTVKMPCTGPNGERLLLGVSIDITELVTLSKSQEIIHQSLEMLVMEPGVNEGIAKAMKSVCEYIGVSRSYIFHFDLERQNVTCIREYCQPGEQKLLEGVQNVPYSTGVNWPEHFQHECFFNFPDLQNPETLELLGPFYAKLIHDGDSRSLYSHRLVIDGKIWGYVGFVYSRNARILDKLELDFIQSAARLIELMIRHKRTQLALHDAVIQAHAAESAKSQFLAAMSHEIRTPLNAVIGFAELLKDGTLPPQEQKDYLNDIAVAGNALLSLINDILDLSKLEAGKMCFVHQPTDFSDLVHEILTVFQQKFKDKHLTAQIDIQDVPRIKTDPLRIRQILFNLIGNAVKFTDHGSIRISGRFIPDENRPTGTFRFAVKDTGCGISEADAKQLFQPFVQSNAMLGTRKAGEGSGLGLMLVRRMLEYMNGEITLDSKLGSGSEFTVTLHQVEYTPSSELSPPAPAAAEVEPPTAPCRILLVDDVAMNLKVLQAMFRKIGIEPVAVGNAAEALAELERQPFDFLLTDLWMPGMNGMELAGRLRRSGKYPRLHIAAVTADSEAGNRFDPLMFDAVLAKPVTIEKLRHFIGKFGARQ